MSPPHPQLTQIKLIQFKEFTKKEDTATMIQNIYTRESKEPKGMFLLNASFLAPSSHPSSSLPQWLTRMYSDNSMQAYYHEFKKVVEAADVIIEVLDARDPMGCRCPDVEDTISAKYSLLYFIFPSFFPFFFFLFPPLPE
jgi:hypothetical protein